MYDLAVPFTLLLILFRVYCTSICLFPLQQKPLWMSVLK